MFEPVLKIFRLPFITAALLFSMPAQAEVAVTFYSHEFGESFPHAFFKMKGKLGTGETIDTSFGFTAVNISPGILWGSVKGHVSTPKPKYISKSKSHFTVTVPDAKYRQLMALVRKWRDKPQKSYSLNKRNCVHFISEAIGLLGYKYNPKTKFWKKPTSFMKEVLALNPVLKK